MLNKDTVNLLFRWFVRSQQNTKHTLKYIKGDLMKENL